MSQVSIWQPKERVESALVPQPGVALDLNVFYPLLERRIYLYLEVASTSPAAGYILEAKIIASKNGTPVATYPASIADFTGLSVVPGVGSLFNAGGSPVGDCYTHRLGTLTNSTVTSAVLQPLRVNMDIDHLQLKFDGFFGTTITGWRAFLGCLSTKY